MTYFTASLRIGNLLSDLSGGTVTVRGITKEGVWIDAAAGPAPSTAFNPIPLTEQWLLKFGFENDKLEYFTMEYDNHAGYGLSYKGNFLTGIEYVHELQNLYFALTGEEINIKS